MERRNVILNLFIITMFVVMLIFGNIVARSDSDMMVFAAGLFVFGAITIAGVLYLQKRYFIVEAKDEMLININTKAMALAGRIVIIGVAIAGVWVFLFGEDLSMDRMGIGWMLMIIMMAYLYAWLIIKTILTRRLSKDV